MPISQSQVAHQPEVQTSFEKLFTRIYNVFKTSDQEKMTEVWDKKFDPLYSITSKPAGYDVDTLRRSTRVVPAQANGSKETGLQTSGAPTTWKWSCDQNHRCNLFNSALTLTLKFVTTAASVAPTGAAPPWNLLGRLIDSLEFKINGQTIYNMPGGSFLPIFTSRMLSNYTLEQLEKHPAVIAPVWKEADIYQSVGANGAAFADDTSALERAKIWGTAGEANNITYKLTVPLCDLLGRIIGAPSNVRNYELIIRWNNTTDVLEKSALNSTGICLVSDTELVIDDWIMSTLQALDDAGEKKQAVPDILPMYVEHCQRITYTGSDIIIPNVRNGQSVMILGFCHGILSNTGNTAKRVYCSPGQFHVWNLGSEDADEFRTKSFLNVDDKSAPPSSLQISYGNESLTASPINLRNGDTGLEASALFYHANLSAGRIGNKTAGSLLPRRAFESTMPFIYFNWASYEAPLRCEAKDLIVRMPTDLKDEDESIKTMYVIIKQYRAVVINVDGTVKERVE